MLGVQSSAFGLNCRKNLQALKGVIAPLIFEQRYDLYGLWEDDLELEVARDFA